MVKNTDLLGQQIGRIRLIDVLGEGGMGAVFVGFDDTLQRKVAVKAIRGEFRLQEETKARFVREARILSQLNHPGICTVHDFIEGEDNDFLVLELIDGTNLRKTLSKGLSRHQMLSIAEQLLDVLVAVHATGVIHRDLKPENVMVKPDGTVKVLDFGLARSADEAGLVPTAAPTLGIGEGPSGDEEDDRLGTFQSGGSVYVRTRLGAVIGTAGYMSPEQARGEHATSASDMYSLGLILQEMFTGKPPFETGLTPSVLLQKTAAGESLPLTGVTGGLKTLTERLKSLAPGARPSSVDAAEQLRSVIDAPKRRRRRLLAVAAWVLILVFGVGMGIQSMRAQRQTRLALEEKERAERIYQDVASSAYRDGEFTLAARVFFTAVENSDDPEFRARNHVMAAWTLFALGDDDEVLRPLREAIRDDPKLQLVSGYYIPEFEEMFEVARAQVDDGYVEAVPRSVRDDIADGEFSDCRSPFGSLEELRSDRPSYLPHLNLVDALACVQPGWSKEQVRSTAGEPTAKPGTGEWHYDWLADNEEAGALFSCSVTFEDGGVVEIIAEVDYEENAEGTE